MSYIVKLDIFMRIRIILQTQIWVDDYQNSKMNY